MARINMCVLFNQLGGWRGVLALVLCLAVWGGSPLLAADAGAAPPPGEAVKNHGASPDQDPSMATLPFSTANPFIWDNDANTDVFTVEFVMGLAHDGTIHLVGITQSPHPYRSEAEDLQAVVAKARAIGWNDIPDAAWDLGRYYKTALSHPASDKIDDTAPLDTPPARFIRDQVLSLGTPAKPVVIGAGGALTTVASAYLLACRAGHGPEFTQRVIVCSNLGLLIDHRPTVSNYNASQDEWAAYICLTQLPMVVVSCEPGGSPQVWDFISALPDNELTRYMKWKQGPQWPYPDSHTDGDADAVLPLLLPKRGEFCNTATRMRFDGWKPWPANWNARFNTDAYRADAQIRPDPAGKVIYISGFSQTAGDELWKKAMAKAFALPNQPSGQNRQ